MAGAMAVTEALFGGKPTLRVAAFLSHVHKQLQQGRAIATGTGKMNCSKMVRFMVMVAQVLEKMSAFSLCWISLKKQILKEVGHTELVFAIEEHFVNCKRRLPINIAALFTGLLLDQGLNAREIYYIYILGFSGGFLPCYLDAQAQPAGTLFL